MGSDDMGELEDYFRANTGRMMVKWQHYFEIYERHFINPECARLAEAGIDIVIGNQAVRTLESEPR